MAFKSIIKKILIIIVIAFAIYGAYTAAKDLKSYISYKINYLNIARKENIKNGVAKIPNLKLIDAGGNALALYDEIKSHEYVILSFGSIYCENCREEYKILQEKNSIDNLPENIAFYLCVPEGSNYIKAFREDTGITLPLYTIDKNEIDQCGIVDIPATALIGNDYKIKWLLTGFKENTMEQILEFIETCNCD